MRTKALLLIVTGLALLPGTALAKPGDGLYVGKTSEGRKVAVRIADGWVARAWTHVACDGFPQLAESNDGGAVRRGRFDFDEDNILSGTGGEDETVHFAGRIDGTRLVGKVEYSYEAAPAYAPDQDDSCNGHARYRARLII